MLGPLAESPGHQKLVPFSLLGGAGFYGPHPHEGGGEEFVFLFSLLGGAGFCDPHPHEGGGEDFVFGISLVDPRRYSVF